MSLFDYLKGFLQPLDLTKNETAYEYDPTIPLKKLNKEAGSLHLISYTGPDENKYPLLLLRTTIDSGYIMPTFNQVKSKYPEGSAGLVAWVNDPNNSDLKNELEALSIIAPLNYKTFDYGKDNTDFKIYSSFTKKPKSFNLEFNRTDNWESSYKTFLKNKIDILSILLQYYIEQNGGVWISKKRDEELYNKGMLLKKSGKWYFISIKDDSIFLFPKANYVLYKDEQLRNFLNIFIKYYNALSPKLKKSLDFSESFRKQIFSEEEFKDTSILKNISTYIKASSTGDVDNDQLRAIEKKESDLTKENPLIEGFKWIGGQFIYKKEDITLPKTPIYLVTNVESVTDETLIKTKIKWTATLVNALVIANEKNELIPLSEIDGTVNIGEGSFFQYIKTQKDHRNAIDPKVIKSNLSVFEKWANKTGAFKDIPLQITITYDITDETDTQITRNGWVKTYSPKFTIPNRTSSYGLPKPDDATYIILPDDTAEVSIKRGYLDLNGQYEIEGLRNTTYIYGKEGVDKASYAENIKKSIKPKADTNSSNYYNILTGEGELQNKFITINKEKNSTAPVLELREKLKKVNDIQRIWVTTGYSNLHNKLFNLLLNESKIKDTGTDITLFNAWSNLAQKNWNPYKIALLDKTTDGLKADKLYSNQETIEDEKFNKQENIITDWYRAITKQKTDILDNDDIKVLQKELDSVIGDISGNDKTPGIGTELLNAENLLIDLKKSLEEQKGKDLKKDSKLEKEINHLSSVILKLSDALSKKNQDKKDLKISIETLSTINSETLNKKLKTVEDKLVKIKTEIKTNDTNPTLSAIDKMAKKAILTGDLRNTEKQINQIKNQLKKAELINKLDNLYKVIYYYYYISASKTQKQKLEKIISEYGTESDNEKIENYINTNNIKGLISKVDRVIEEKELSQDIPKSIDILEIISTEDSNIMKLSNTISTNFKRTLLEGVLDIIKNYFDEKDITKKVGRPSTQNYISKSAFTRKKLDKSTSALNIDYGVTLKKITSKQIENLQTSDWCFIEMTDGTVYDGLSGEDVTNKRLNDHQKLRICNYGPIIGMFDENSDEYDDDVNAVFSTVYLETLAELNLLVPMKCYAHSTKMRVLPGTPIFIFNHLNLTGMSSFFTEYTRVSVPEEGNDQTQMKIAMSKGSQLYEMGAPASYTLLPYDMPDDDVKSYLRAYQNEAVKLTNRVYGEIIGAGIKSVGEIDKSLYETLQKMPLFKDFKKS